MDSWARAAAGPDCVVAWLAGLSDAQHSRLDGRSGWEGSPRATQNSRETLRHTLRSLLVR